jgi:plastocyanin
MTVRTRVILSITFVLALGGIVGLVGLDALLPLGARSPEPREVVVVARDMSFFVGDGVAANPIIQVAPGERIRITLINADPGYDHDFVVTAWRVNTPVLHGEGRTSLVIQAPDLPGRATYVCSMHESMMKGTIEVIASRPALPAR